MAAQRVFVADASHQLRTPLTALRVSLDNIAEGVDDPDAREDVDQATAEVVRMSRLVNGLLALARAEANPAGAEPVLVTDVVEQRLAVWRPEGAERGVGFEALPTETRAHSSITMTVANAARRARVWMIRVLGQVDNCAMA